MLQEAVEWLAAEEFWLPEGVRWEQVRRGPEYYIYAVPLLVALLLRMRSLVERFDAAAASTHCDWLIKLTCYSYLLYSWIAVPIGKILWVSDKPHTRPPPCNVLWTAYKHNKNPTEEQVWMHRQWPSCFRKLSLISVMHLQVVFLSAQLGWTPYRVHKWFWRARKRRKPSTLTKFKESL